MRNPAQLGGAIAAPDTAADGELDLAAVSRAVWRKKWWILGPTLIVAVLSSVVVNVMTPKYKSEARVLIEGRENVFLRPEAEKTDRDRAVVDPEAVTSQVQLVLSRDLALQVIKQLKLGERQEFDPVLRGISPLTHVLTLLGIAKDPLRMSPEERVLEAYYDRLTVFPVDKSRVIAIEFQSADSELAARVANTIAETYVGLTQTAKQDQTRSASKWLASEIDSLRQKVSDAEARVEQFRAKSNLLVGTNNTTLSNQQLAELNSQLAAARTQKADAEAKARLIRDMLRSGQIEASEIVNSELIRRLAEQRVTLRAQLAEQSSTLLDQHPRIKELRAQIADLDRQLRSEAEKLARALENDSRIAGARLEALSANLDQLKRQAASTNEQDVQLRAFEREAKAQRDLLESYLAKYREATARDNIGATPADARIISRAIALGTPYSPKKLPIVLIATLATLLLSVGFITTGELLAGNVYRPLVPLQPTLVAATVPAFEAPPVAPVVPNPEPHVSRAEEWQQAIDELARRLSSDEAGRRVAVFGIAPKVGTTSVAVALARTLARHARVVLIDLAFSSPRVAAISSDPGAPGIADLLTGAASFAQIIARDHASRAHVIAAGRVGTDDGGIIASDRLGIAIDALARSYDHVIIDGGLVIQAAADRIPRLVRASVIVTGDQARQGTNAHDLAESIGLSDAIIVSVGPPPETDTRVAQPAAA